MASMLETACRDCGFKLSYVGGATKTSYRANIVCSKCGTVSFVSVISPHAAAGTLAGAFKDAKSFPKAKDFKYYSVTFPLSELPGSMSCEGGECSKPLCEHCVSYLKKFGAVKRSAGRAVLFAFVGDKPVANSPCSQYDGKKCLKCGSAKVETALVGYVD